MANTHFDGGFVSFNTSRDPVDQQLSPAPSVPREADRIVSEVGGWRGRAAAEVAA